MSKIFFQIGTNNGNDMFRDLIKQEKPDLVILIEPNKTLINQIKTNYKDVKNVIIYNNAIYYNNDELVELYIPAKKGIIGTKADNGMTYSTGHFSLLPMNDWGEKDDMVKITAKSITFDEICKVNNITNIEYLQIDTEGFDCEIIKMIDLKKYKIKQIRFEKWGFNTNCFTKYHKELSENLGNAGMNFAINKLKEHNYTINDIRDKSGNDIIATLIQ